MMISGTSGLAVPTAPNKSRQINIKYKINIIDYAQI